MEFVFVVLLIIFAWMVYGDRKEAKRKEQEELAAQQRALQAQQAQQQQAAPTRNHFDPGDDSDGCLSTIWTFAKILFLIAFISEYGGFLLSLLGSLLPWIIGIAIVLAIIK